MSYLERYDREKKKAKEELFKNNARKSTFQPTEPPRVNTPLQDAAEEMTKIPPPRIRPISVGNPWERNTPGAYNRQRIDRINTPRSYDPQKENLPRYSLGKGLLGAVDKGIRSVSEWGSEGLAFAEDVALAPFELMSGLELGDLSDEGILNRFNETIKRENAKAAEKYEENIRLGGKPAELLDTFGSATVAAVPQAVMAMLTGGGSLAAQTTAGLRQAASSALSPGLTTTVSNVVKTMKSNPQYWTSFAQVVGPGYEQAIEDQRNMGETDEFSIRSKAALQALANGLLNAAVEVGGGIETLPNELKPGGSAWKALAETSWDEAKEEMVQGVIERAMQNITYNAGNPIFSTTNDRAVLNPMTALEEAAGGAIVGGVLGGAEIGVNNILRAAYEASAKKNNNRPNYVENVQEPQLSGDDNVGENVQQPSSPEQAYEQIEQEYEGPTSVEPSANELAAAAEENPQTFIQETAPVEMPAAESNLEDILRAAAIEMYSEAPGRTNPLVSPMNKGKWIDKVDSASVLDAINKNKATVPQRTIEQTTPVVESANEEPRIDFSKINEDETQFIGTDRTAYDYGDDIDEHNIQYVKKSAESLGATAKKIFSEFYGVEQDPTAYVKVMTAAYNAGKAGTDLSTAVATDEYGNIIGAYPPQVRAAYDAGRIDAKAEAAPVAKEKAKAYTESKEEPTRKDEKKDKFEKYSDEDMINAFYGKGPLDVIDKSAVEKATDEELTEVLGELGREKEDTVNGNRETEPPERVLEEVHDTEGVSDASEPGPGTGGLLDGVSSEDVRQDEGTGDSAENPGERGGRSGRHGRRSDSAGVSGGRSAGSDARADVSAPSGEVEETAKQEEPTVESEIEQKEAIAVQEKPRGENFSFESTKVRIPNTPKQRFNANKAAIQTLKTIIAEDRVATPDEQATLAKYTGWGGISEAFDERKTDWQKEYKQLKKILSDDEYKAARSTVTDAYYTDPEIIHGMYSGLEKIGYNGGRMLEPSAGIGRFIGAMPAKLSDKISSWTAIEIDPITGNIAKYLYPNADVRVMGYQDAKIPDAYMDVAIGNVPFGNISIADRNYPSAITKSIHNYFIAKTLDKVRPGGIAALITTSATMDISRDARQYFAKKADLIGAIRLPNTAFKGTQTGVISDILVFKVREPGTKYSGEEFINIEPNQLAGPGVYGNGMVNEYFNSHPEMVLGIPKRVSGRWGSEVTYDPLDTRISLEKQIERAMGKIDAKMEYPVRKTSEQIRKEIKADAGKAKEGSIVKKNGKLYKAKGGQLVDSDLTEKQAAKMSDIVSIRDTARSLLDLQVDGASDADIAAKRKALNAEYDAFVKKNGSLNSNKRLIHNDSDYPFIMALEDYNKETGDVKKAAIFTTNTVAPVETVTHADTVDEAITVVMNEDGKINANRIAQLTGESVEKATEEMLSRRLVFKDRDGNLQTAEQYLAGNVRAKLHDAEALAEGDPDYIRNVEELKKVIPEDIPPEDINVRLGATWVPDTVYSNFASHMLGGRQGGEYAKPSISVKYQPAVGKFFITINDSWMKNRPENTTEWGTPDYPFVGGRNSILDAALNNKNVTVYRTVDDHRIVDKQATAAAQEKLNNVLDEFKDWLWSDENRRGTLAPLYNEMFNNTVTPNYNGEHLTVLGSNPKMPMRPHQKNAVQRIINSGGNTLLAHRVGAGKTYEMAAAAMKLRQLGIVKKPLFAVPKHLVAQWGNEFLSYFPAAKILVLEDGDFSKSKRTTFANRIATGDYDAVIMSYEQFGMVPMSKENQESFYQSQVDAIELAIQESKAASGRDPSIRDMERSKKNFEAKLKKLGDSKKDQDNIDFEQLGVDSLFVDEAHNFKNLYYVTKMNNVSDLGDKDGSQRAFDLYMKVRYLQKLNGGRGIVFATATPVMNSVVELYTMQRYLQGDLLDARGITNFDAWANQFGEVMPIRKMKPGGNGYDIRMSLSKYKNMAELQQMFRAFSDVIVDPEDLPYLKIPKMKDGKRIVVESEPSDFQESFMEQLGERAEKLRGAGKGGSDDHIFKIMADGKKISYTQRMIDPSTGYEDGGKIMKCVQNVHKIWNDTKGQKGTQLIFCDRGTPGGAEAQNGVSLYEDMKNFLVGYGIPEKEIAFIHDADTDEKKNRLFKNVKSGSVRVLIGSTAKMGTGMNVQDRIVAIHELNAPDRPGDLEQNEGRGLRQGNMNDEVAVYTYVTKKTFDSRQWDNLKRKATFIHQVMSGNYSGREAAGDGDLALSAAEISAIASDNPLIIEQFEISEKIANLEALEKAHKREVADSAANIKSRLSEIEFDKNTLAAVKKDDAKLIDVSGDKFTAKISGKVFTDRKSAGAALIAEAKKIMNPLAEDETRKLIGSFAGLDLYVTSEAEMLLKGNGQYRGVINMSDPAATMVRLQNVADRIPNLIKTIEARVSENTASISKLEAAVKAPFAKKDELAAAKRREREIIAVLNPESEIQEVDIDDESDDSDSEDTVHKSISRDEVANVERWRTTRVGDETTTVKPLSEIVEEIRHDFGFNITTGHVRGTGVEGQFSDKDRGIRTRIANNLPVITHELGHALDNRYGIISKSLPADVKKELDNALGDMRDNYDKKDWIFEGFAEYIRKYLKNREVAAIDYPAVTKHFLNSMSPEDAARIEQLADEVNAYYSLDADTATSSIRLREEGTPDARTTQEKIMDKARVLYQAWVDSNNGIKNMDKATGSETYKLASNSVYSDAIAGQILIGDLTDENGQYVGPGLKAALHGIDLLSENEYRLFGEYLAVLHGPERLAEGMRVFADDRKNSTLFMEGRVREIEQDHPEFVEAAHRLFEFQRAFLQTWGVDTGLVSSASAKEWGERWQYYVPLNRAVGKDRRGRGAKRGFANQTSTIKRARGSGLDIVHPVDNIINNVVVMVNAGVRNNVMRAITKHAADDGVDASFIEKVPTPMVKKGFDLSGIKKDLSDKITTSSMEADDKVTADRIIGDLEDILYQYSRGKAYGNVVTVMNKGKPEFWKVNDTGLLESLTNLSPKKAEGVMDAYAIISRFMTMNITGNNLIWAFFSNFPRDLATFYTYSKNKNLKDVFSSMAASYTNMLKGDHADALFKEYLAMGGGKTSVYSADRALAKDTRKRLSPKKSRNPLDLISFISDMIETGPRYATYKMAREAGATPQEAFYEATDITVNFRRGGRLSKEVNKFVPFFGASVQGLDKFRRWITAEDVPSDTRKKAVRSRVTMYVTVSAAIAGVFYALNNADEEREEDYEQLSAFVKNSYWNIPIGDGKYFAISKPRELAVFSSFIEALLGFTSGENKHALDGFGEYAAANLLPNVISDIAVGDIGSAASGLGLIGVTTSIMANRDFLGRPIVPAGVANLEPELQYNNRTSKIAYWIGKAFNVSPMKVDYFFNGVLGGWWKHQRALFPVGENERDFTLGVKNMYIKDNLYSQDLTNWMFEKRNESSVASNSHPDDIEKAITATMDNGMADFVSRYMKLSRDKKETEKARATRQTVLTMVLEYQKADDSGKPTALQERVYNLCRKTGKTELLPSAMPTSVKDGNGKTVNIGPDLYVEYQTDYLRIYWDQIEENVKPGMDTKTAAAAVKAAKNVAKDSATNRILKRHGAAPIKRMSKYDGLDNDTITEFKYKYDLADDDGSRKQDEVIDILEGMNLDDDEFNILWHTLYESDKNNPRA